MKRIIENINPDKWYHLKTVEKHLNFHRMVFGTITDAKEDKFTTIEFRKLFSNIRFVQNPKNGRIRYLAPGALHELGFEY